MPQQLARGQQQQVNWHFGDAQNEATQLARCQSVYFFEFKADMVHVYVAFLEGSDEKLGCLCLF